MDIVWIWLNDFMVILFDIFSVWPLFVKWSEMCRIGGQHPLKEDNWWFLFFKIIRNDIYTTWNQSLGYNFAHWIEKRPLGQSHYGPRSIKIVQKVLNLFLVLFNQILPKVSQKMQKQNAFLKKTKYFACNSPFQAILALIWP